MAKTAAILDIGRDRTLTEVALYAPAIIPKVERAGLMAALKAGRKFSLEPPSPQMASFLKLIAESPEVVNFEMNIRDALDAATAPVGGKEAHAMKVTAARPATTTKPKPTGISPRAN